MGVFVNFSSELCDNITFLSGHAIVQLCLILCTVPLNPCYPVVADRFLTYVQCFDIVPQINSRVTDSAQGPLPDAASGMYVLKRTKRRDRTQEILLGDIVPLNQVWSLIELTPRFGDQAD
jgi:hypothetical protein